MELGLVFSIVLAIASALGGGGIVWGSLRTEVRHIKQRAEEHEERTERLEKEDREYLRQVVAGLVDAVTSITHVTERVIEWEERHDERIAANQRRSRSNRSRIRRLEEQDLVGAKRRLREVGVPDEVLEEVSAAMDGRDWDTTGPTAAGE